MSATTSAMWTPTWDQKVLAWIDALALWRGRRTLAPPHLLTGLRGEELAFFYLRQRGYIVVARRWKTPKVFGDVDLIAWEGETLCFIEVKTRTRRDLVPAEFAVDQQKQKMLRSMAGIFRKRLPEETRRKTLVRFDIISIYLGDGIETSSPEIEHIPAAFAFDPS